jgi:ribosomal protein S18 acetylase RimI-like enzyme
MLTIRRASPLDAAIISDLVIRTFKETFGNLFTTLELEDYLQKTFGIEKLESSLNKLHNVFAIAYVNEVPADYYKIKLHSDIEDIDETTMIQLQKIYVLQQYLDKKIGKELMLQMLSLPEIKGFKYIWLVVLHTNDRAIGFYKHFGFAKLKKHYYRIGSQHLEYELMIKKL